MGIYARYIFPRFIDLVMRDKEATRLRAAWVPRAHGVVLEVGIGSGLNLPFYSSEVKRIYGVDPSAELQEMARARATQSHRDVVFLTQSSEVPLPLDPRSIDTAVITWAMCSIPNVFKALEQVKRVLKPEGRLIFLEHGRAPEPGVVIWQDRMTPLWKRIGCGCHLNRRIDALITQAGFRIAELTAGYLPGPRLMTYTYQGYAQPSADEA